MHPEVIHLATLKDCQFFVYVLTVFQYLHGTYYFKSSLQIHKAGWGIYFMIYGHIYVLYMCYETDMQTYTLI